MTPNGTLANSNEESNVDLESVSLLIPRVKNGDVEARNKLLNELRGFLSLIARENIHGSLKQKVGSSDIVQMAMLRVVQNFETFTGSTNAELRPWLRKIVVNEILRAFQFYQTGKRDIKLEQPLEADSEDIHDFLADGKLTPSSEAMATERIELFRSMLHELTLEHAQVIRLRSIDLLSFKEVGHVMNRSEDAVSKLWYRAMLKLEGILIENGNFNSL